MVDLTAAYPPGEVILRDVTLRDGLQLTRSWPSTAQKCNMVTALHYAGLRHFEVGSFLPADRMPQFADVRDMIRAVNTLSGSHGIALALNARGALDALQTDVSEITMVISRRQAEMAIFEYINGFHNPRRRHSALGGKSPVAFERKVA